MQKYWDMTVTYEIGDASDVLDYQTFKDWMTVDSSGNVSFDWNHIADWIGQLADKYDTFGTDETFHTSLGETVTVTSMNYGWKMDEETERHGWMRHLNQANLRQDSHSGWKVPWQEGRKRYRRYLCGD